jgi:hypothetical protein
MDPNAGCAYFDDSKDYIVEGTVYVTRDGEADDDADDDPNDSSTVVSGRSRVGSFGSEDDEDGEDAVIEETENSGSSSIVGHKRPDHPI